MSFVVGGLIIGGATLAGAAISANASRRAANTQAAAAQQATDTQKQIFDTVNQQQAPYRQAGYSALGSLAQGLELSDPNAGTPGTPTSDVNSGLPANSLLRTFGPGDLPAYLAPNFDFALKYGQGATSNMANAMGGLGGNSLAEISKWTTGFAGDQYQRAFENYNTNQTNIFNRLASIAGLGQTAGSASTTGAPQFAQGIAGSQMGMGNAIAAGQVGVANAFSGGINNAMGWYQLNNLLKNNNTGGGTGWATIGSPGSSSELALLGQ